MYFSTIKPFLKIINNLVRSFPLLSLQSRLHNRITVNSGIVL